jgi:3-oxoacyl-[acyl-carrier protein] reductase
MDLGLQGKAAIVCASSRGLGLACARALADAGVNVVINGRNAPALAEAAAQLANSGHAAVRTVAGDLTTDEGRAALLSACPEPDILITNNAGPQPARLDALDRERLMQGLELNLLTPLALMRAVVPGMAARNFGRIVNITSVAVMMPVPGLELSSAARAGLTALAVGMARSFAAASVTVNNILPGYFATDRLIDVFASTAQREGTTPDTIQARQLAQIPCRRLGSPRELGDLCAFLCSLQAGYITGQNILIDGGLFDRNF